MRKTALLFLFLSLLSPFPVVAQLTRYVGEVDFSGRDFPQVKHAGDPFVVTNLIAGLVDKETKFNVRIAVPQYISPAEPPPGKMPKRSAYDLSEGKRLLGAIYVKRSSSAYAKEVPFAAVFGERGPAPVMLEIVFNPKAGINAITFAAAYRESAKEEIEDFEKRYAQAQEEKEKSRKADREEEEKRFDPDFLDTPGFMYSVEGRYDEIKNAVMDVLAEISENHRQKFEIFGSAVSSRSKYAKKNDEGFEGLLIISVNFIPQTDEDPRIPEVPYILIKGVKNTQKGFFDICFNPYEKELSQRAVVAALEKKLGITQEPVKDGPDRNFDAGNAMRKSPDKFDFYDENLHFEEISGRVNIIVNALMQTLRDIFSEDKTAKFVILDGCIPDSSRRTSHKDLLQSADTDKFEEGFRIVYYNASNYKSGISVLAVFGESDSDTGKFDLIFNPALKIEHEKFMSEFKDSQTRMETGQRPRGKYDPPSFTGKDFVRMSAPGNIDTVKRALSQAFTSLKPDNNGLQYREMLLFAGKPKASDKDKERDLYYGFTMEAPGKPTPVVMIRGTHWNADSFEVVLHPDAGVDTREFSIVLSRLLRKR